MFDKGELKLRSDFDCPSCWTLVPFFSRLMKKSSTSTKQLQSRIETMPPPEKHRSRPRKPEKPQARGKKRKRDEDDVEPLQKAVKELVYQFVPYVLRQQLTRDRILEMEPTKTLANCRCPISPAKDSRLRISPP